MKVLVTGKNGQLGMSIHQITSSIKQNHDFIFIDRDELDFSQKDSISKYFKVNNFDVVVNCSAYTAVDRAESEFKLANQINHISVRKIATIAKKRKIKLIHISTDAVFNGDAKKAYTENDNRNAINSYGKTKLLGEKAIQNTMPHNAIIIRTSWMYSKYGNNFVKTILKLGLKKDNVKVINDQIGSPTYAPDLAQAIINIIHQLNLKTGPFSTQIYNYSNLGHCSWFKFTKKIFELAQVKCQVTPIASDSYPLIAKRPKFTALNSKKIIKDFGLKIPKWEESISKYIKLLE